MLTRQPQAIEALGTTTVLRVDTAGTRTCKRIALVGLAVGTSARLRDLDPEAVQAFGPLLQAAAAASVAEGLEPMYQAVLRLHPAPAAPARSCCGARACSPAGPT